MSEDQKKQLEQQLWNIANELREKTKLKSVYDPTCGSGSLLLRVAKEVEEVSNFYGQELNRTTYNLARINMILHDVHYRIFDIKQENALEHPQHNTYRAEAIRNTVEESKKIFEKYFKIINSGKDLYLN